MNRFSKSTLGVSDRGTKTRALVTRHSIPGSTDQHRTLLPKAKQNRREKKAFLLCTSQALSAHHCCIVRPLSTRVMWSCLVLLIPRRAHSTSWQPLFLQNAQSQLKSSMQRLVWAQEMGVLWSVLAKGPQNCQGGFYWSVLGAVVTQSWKSDLTSESNSGQDVL